jgi:hypothetical protein
MELREISPKNRANFQFFATAHGKGQLDDTLESRGPSFKPDFFTGSFAGAGYCRNGTPISRARWRAIKEGFSGGERGIWQRRYWEHTIRDDRDLAAHLDYIHFNPVKHGLVEHPAEWPHSSFRRCVAGGLYPAELMRNAGEPPETGERMNRNGQSRRRQNVSFQSIIVGDSPIRRRQLEAKGAAVFRLTLAARRKQHKRPHSENSIPG